MRAKSLLWGASLGTESSRISSLKRQCIALAGDGCCRYNNLAPSTFDPVKREKALADRGLDFADAALVFEGVTLEVEDIRRNYGETRIICYGLLRDRLVVVGYTPRGASRHVFSMRTANEREKARVTPLLEI